MKSLVESIIAWGPPGLLLVAALDSAGVPIPAAVDVLLTALAANAPERAFFCALMAVTGSLAGSMLLFFLARKGGEAYLERHSLSPRGRRLRGWFQHYGLLTVFISAISPLPLPMKLFVISSGALGIRPSHFFLTVLAARTPRYFGLAYLGSQMGTGARAYLQAHIWEIAAVLLLLFAILFGCVKWMDRRRAEAASQV